MKIELPDDIHKVISHKDESIPLFESRWLDIFSRVSWFVPLVIFVPVITYCLYLSIVTFAFSISITAAYILGGIFLWSVIEYFFHRFVFHYSPKSQIGKKIFFTVHGVHHAFPGDSLRLVMPPSLSIPLSTFFFFVFKWTFGVYYLPLFTGFLLGYLFYDMMHYAVHHAHFIKFKWFLKMKEHHMIHHFKDPDNGFGVTSDIWDKVMRTEFPFKK